jgi:hypothetical protein
MISILILAFVQNIAFSLVSRSRNRDNFQYHLVASIFSNAVFFLTFRELMLAEMTMWLMLPYTLGTVTGSLTGTKISMWVERLLNARSDSHLEVKDDRKH